MKAICQASERKKLEGEGPTHNIIWIGFRN